MSYRPIPVKPLVVPKRESMIFGAIPAPAIFAPAAPARPALPKTTAKIEKKRGIIARLFGVAK